MQRVRVGNVFHHILCTKVKLVLAALPTTEISKNVQATCVLSTNQNKNYATHSGDLVKVIRGAEHGLSNYFRHAPSRIVTLRIQKMRPDRNMKLLSITVKHCNM